VSRCQTTHAKFNECIADRWIGPFSANGVGRPRHKAGHIFSLLRHNFAHLGQKNAPQEKKFSQFLIGWPKWMNNNFYDLLPFERAAGMAHPRKKHVFLLPSHCPTLRGQNIRHTLKRIPESCCG
jgi:hypothetical protein